MNILATLILIGVLLFIGTIIGIEITLFSLKSYFPEYYEQFTEYLKGLKNE